MEYLEIAKHAVKLCHSCRRQLPFVMYPRLPERSCELAHIDYSNEHTIYFCDAQEHMEQLIIGYSGGGDQFPIFEDGYAEMLGKVAGNQELWAEQKERAKQKKSAKPKSSIEKNADTINALFAEAINHPSEVTKLAEAGGAFIRQKLRELSSLRKIVPPVMVTKEDTQRSAQCDGLIQLVDHDPDSPPSPLTWHGEPDANYVTGPHSEVGFFTVSSDLFEETETELLSYEKETDKCSSSAERPQGASE